MTGISICRSFMLTNQQDEDGAGKWVGGGIGGIGEAGSIWGRSLNGVKLRIYGVGIGV